MQVNYYFIIINNYLLRKDNNIIKLIDTPTLLFRMRDRPVIKLF